MLFRYEDILGNEIETFDKVSRHLELSSSQRSAVLKYARKFAYNPQKKKDGHIRNPKPSQWKEVFTPNIVKLFNEQYGDILQLHGYA